MYKYYYESLLVNDADAFLKSRKRAGRERLLAKICTSFHPEVPQATDQVGSPTPEDLLWWDTHVRKFVSLILEESRHSIAEALHKRWNQPRYQGGLQLRIEFDEIRGERGPPQSRRGVFNEEDIKLFQRFSTVDWIDLMRTGTVVELVPVDSGKRNVGKILLGTLSHQVWTRTKSRQTIERGRKAIKLYANDKHIPQDGRYTIHPLTSLLSYARQIEACCCLQPRLYPDLMSIARAPGKALEKEDIASSKGANEVAVSSADLAPGGAGVPTEGTSEAATTSDIELLANAAAKPRLTGVAEMFHFAVPQMNESQQNASTEFLSSSPGSIVLVQGPPGTGKTSLLTATICNFLQQRRAAGIKQPRLMVCAPSNKAVTVLAARYLEAENTKTSPFRTALVGDKDKMLSENRSRFKDIFVYDWLSSMMKELKGLCKGLSWRNRAQRRSQVVALVDRLCDNIPVHALRSERGARILIGDILSKIDSFQQDELDKAVVELARKLEGHEREIQRGFVERANVIFCTLSSAGAAIVKKSKPVEALIIDEAAAAVEPETYIPMALGPKRIMIVGDPKQLPATILSQHARSRGFSISLQERLMKEKRTYTLLNVQYRMRPEISSFPSTAFYEDSISDGSNVVCPSYRSPVHRTLLRDQPYSFIQVNGEETKQSSGSFQNTKEAEAVVALLLDLRRQTGGDHLWTSIDRIRVITFYQAQVELICNMMTANGLQQVAVSTVDSSQGSEADLVVISFVRTGDAETVGFLSDDRRLNVALTRAKHKLICVGNASRLATVNGKGATTIRSLVKDVMDRKNLISTYSPNVKVIRAPPVHSHIWKRRQQPNQNGRKQAKRQKRV